MSSRAGWGKSCGTPRAAPDRQGQVPAAFFKEETFVYQFAEEISQLIFLASGEPFVQFMQGADFMTEKIYLPGLFLQPVVECRVVRFFLSDDNIPATVPI